MTPYHGPTVHQMAMSRIREINRLIQELEDEKRMLSIRLRTQRYANMLEAERMATDAERFMPNPIAGEVVLSEWQTCSLDCISKPEEEH